MSGTTRRTFLELGIAAAAVCAAGRARAAGPGGAGEVLTRAIPSTGEKLPIVGLGTNRMGAATPEELAARREVLRRLPELGGRVVDTAPAYGQSEEVIGKLVGELANRDRLWIATKVTAPGGDAAAGRKMLEESLRKLRTERVELIQVHNLSGTREMLPVLREWKQAKKLRYVGVTTSRTEQHEELMRIMRAEPIDFIQVDYSIGNRAAADKVLPLAAEKKLGVLINVPFGGRRKNVLATVGERPLPPWAAELDARSWAPLFLKYVVSPPAVTAASPGTTSVAHLEDNLGAARGRLPDAAMRRRIEQLFDGMAP